jgi:hypothetical protein
MTVMGYGLIVGAVALVILVMLAVLVSNRVHYQESVLVNAPPDQVFAAIRSQEDLMAWSAWPAATGSTCRLVGPDNQVGTKVEFITKGKVSGSQTVTEIAPGERVKVALSDPSPFGQLPFVTFYIRSHGVDASAATLEFTNTIRRPFQLIVKGVGIARWVRQLHRKDLAGLKAFCERRALSQRQSNTESVARLSS